MNDPWPRIEHLLETQYPVILSDFNPPCSSEDLSFLREATQDRLPDLYRFYERHDGQQSYDLAFSSPWRLLSVWSNHRLVARNRSP
jgi:cell wall assembly regulator SMI1